MRLLLAIISGFVCSLLMWLSLAIGQIGNHTPASQWVREAYQYKDEIAERIQEPKIAIIAGSNALFGLNSAMLSDNYHRRVVNYGVNAGVGLEYIIKRGQGILKPGDIALLPIEYGMFNYDDDTNSVMLDYYLSDASLFYRQSLYLQFNLLLNLSVKRLYEGYIGLPAGFKVQGLYGAHNMNESGDQLNSALAQRHVTQLEVLQQQVPSRDGKDFSAHNKSWKILQALQKHADNNNICLIYIPATIMYNRGYKEIASEKAYYGGIAKLAREKGLTYVGDPFDFMYPTESYFDTNYHLVSEQRNVHTQNIIDLLGTNLNSYCH